MNSLTIDLKDLRACRDLMDRYGDIKDIFVGHNDAGEITHTSITHQSIVMETYQDNGWTRQNWLYYDGSTEEIFKREE